MRIKYIFFFVSLFMAFLFWVLVGDLITLCTIILAPNLPLYQIIALKVAIIGILFTAMYFWLTYFKEDINRAFHGPKIKIDLLKNKRCELIERKCEKLTGSSDIYEEDFKVDCYYLRAFFSNYGKSTASKCYIRPGNLYFQGASEPMKKLLATMGNQLTWEGKSEKIIDIPEGETLSVILLESLSAETDIIDSSEIGKKSGKPRLRIAGFDIQLPYEEGTFTCDFSVLGENVKPFSFGLSIWWNRKWCWRWTEMTDNLHVLRTS